MDIVVAAFYRFTPLSGLGKLRSDLLHAARNAGTLGTILIAPEGINGTVAGSRRALSETLDAVMALPGCAGLAWKESLTDTNPFYRMKVRLKKEIVSMGVGGLHPENSFRQYVEPRDWNALITDGRTLLVDTRNAYEISAGAFRGAVNPQTASFREFPQWFMRYRQQRKVDRVAMYCTGGIRCEKSAAFLSREGVGEIFHLKGGILGYLAQTEPECSLWEGECFVFDRRVTVGHDLKPGSYGMCHACRHPLSRRDMQAPEYEEGLSCPYCYGRHPEKRRQALAERQHQITLAQARGQQHIGATQTR